MSEKVPMTKDGFIKLKKELEYLKKHERPRVIDAIREARELGDLSENAEYSAAKEKQSFVEGKIQSIQDKLARSQVIDTSNFSNEKIVFGATVKIVDIRDDTEKKYRIVGVDEADIDNGKISVTSPIGRGLIGRSAGDLTRITTPSGVKEYEIIDIYFE